MRAVLIALATSMVALLRSRASLHLEILALRHQLAVLKGDRRHPRLKPSDRLLWVWLSRGWSGWQEALLAGNFPWAKLRQGQKLLRLANKYSRERLDAACRRALFFELINVRRVEEILKRALDREAQGPSTSPPGQLVLLPPSRFLRTPHHFTHERKEPDHGDQPVPQDRPQTPEALGTAPDAPRPPGLREEGEAP